MRKLTDIQHYKDIADAIREKNGSNDTYRPEDMAAAIAAITTGSGMELVKKYSYDKMMIRDGVIEALPSYSTSTKTLVAAGQLEQIVIDTDNYFYFVFTRGLTIPIYNTTNKGTGREEYHIISYLGYPYYGPSDVPCISDPEQAIDLSTTGLSKQSGEQFIAYWYGTSIRWSTGLYGAYQSLSNVQTTGGNKLVVKSPALCLSGNNTYLNSTYWAELTDIRYQYVIEVYRTPKQEASNNYWWNYEYIFERIKTNDHTLDPEEEQGLPTGYTACEYVRGNANAYFATDLYLTSESQVEADLQFEGTSGNVYGCYSGTSAENNFCLYGGSSSQNAYIRYDGDVVRAFVAENGTRYSIIHNKNGFWANGTQEATAFGASSFTCTAPFTVGQLTGSSSAKLKGRIYRITVKDSGNTVMDLVPCKDGNDVYGMYDLVGRTFYMSEGTAFTGA